MAGPAAEVLANLRGKLEGFQEHLPLIKALRNPGLRDRHWDNISQSETHQIFVWPCVPVGCFPFVWHHFGRFTPQRASRLSSTGMSEKIPLCFPCKRHTWHATLDCNSAHAYHLSLHF